MRSNPWQITAIIAIILVVVLIVPLVIMGRNHQTLADETKQAKAAAQEAAQKAATAQGDAEKLTELISGVRAAPLTEVQKQHADVMEKALPGEDAATRSYFDALTAMISGLDNAKREQEDWQRKYEQLESDYNNAKNNYQALEDRLQDDLRKVENQRTADKNTFDRQIVDHSQELEKMNAEQKIILARGESEERKLNDRANQLEFAMRDIGETNRYLAGLLEDVRNPNVEYPAGKILSVDQRAGLAIVNLGSADGLLVRTMFSVYHSSITGLSFHTAPVGKEAVYCDVCKREVSRNVSKASVEVMRILGEHRAEVRILDDILTDPIMVGDVVYSPIWRPGQKLRFALTAGMHLPGSSIESGTEAVKRLIEMNGGVVDCWIEETVPFGEEHLRGSLTDLTNYIVVSEGTTRILEPEAARAQEALKESARNRAVKTISLDDLLSRMNWRNVTPGYVAGSQEFLPDVMRVIPQQQGTTHQSSGTVAPVFTPDNVGARVDARDANPVRTSPGTVSPLYNGAAPPPPNSGGSTSELFRPRRPVGGQN